MGLLDHHENCKRVLSGDISLNQLVKSARLACGAASAKITVKALAQQELKAFRQAAATAVDRHLPAAGDGTPASELPINRELLHFVSVVTPNIRLGARAGSGKSTALVIKTDFLINELGLDPGLIQIVTFNTAASASLAARLSKALGPDVGGRVRVNTFHSLARAVVVANPKTAATKLMFKKDDDPDDASPQALARAVNAVITQDDLEQLRAAFSQNDDWNYLAKDPTFDGEVRKLLSRAAVLFRARRGGPVAVQDTRINAILARICAHHEKHLADNNELDFEAAVRKAAELLAMPDSRFAKDNTIAAGVDGKTRFLMIDEFQDFSPAFHQLTAAIMQRNLDCVLNAVGDDWQAINGYMGSNLKFFKGFRKDWGPALTLPLRANWRCAKRMVTLGNSVMAASKDDEAVAARPEQGTIRVPREGKIQTRGRERDVWEEEARVFVMEHLEVLLRYARQADEKAGRKAGTLALIASKNNPYGIKPEVLLQEASRVWTDGEVVFVTAHKSKGREWDHVILLDGIDGQYPNGHPGDVLTEGLVSASEKKAAGERLLYVAVTRAIRSLAILAPTELHPRLITAKELARL